MAHPATMSDVTAAWLTEVLRGAGVLRQAAVLDAAIQPIGEGLGFLSNRAR